MSIVDSLVCKGNYSLGIILSSAGRSEAFLPSFPKIPKVESDELDFVHIVAGVEIST